MPNSRACRGSFFNGECMKYRLLLVLAALIWGSAFVAQVVGMDTIGPFTFGGVRFLLGSASLLPIIYMNRHKENPKSTKIPLWAAFLMTGLPLCRCHDPAGRPAVHNGIKGQFPDSQLHTLGPLLRALSGTSAPPDAPCRSRHCYYGRLPHVHQIRFHHQSGRPHDASLRYFLLPADSGA